VIARLLGVLGLALSVAPSTAADPHVDYLLECQGCHLGDGSSTPGSVPALADSVGRFLSVEGGREYLVRVPGVSQSSLDDARLAAVLNWILVEFDPAAVPADFVPFSAEEVARVRRPPLTDVEGVRARLLAEIGRETPGR
jgi:hypothetical protein